MTQRDFLVELEDAKRIDSVEVQAIVNRLPAAELVPLPDVAAALNCSVATVEALYDSGELRGINFGTRTKRRIRISRTSLITYLKEGLK